MAAIKVEGAEKILKKLRAFSVAKQNTIMVKGFREGAKITRKAIVKNIKTRRLTGAMSKGLTTKRKRTRNGVMLVITSPTREKLEKNNPTYDSKKSGYYPGNQEFGTKYVTKQDAYGKGFRQTQANAQDVSKRRIWAEIKKELAKR